MGKLQIWIYIFFFASMSLAQTISLNGKVSNASGQAISGAVVELINQGLKDTTGADGMYAFSGAVDVIRPIATGENITMVSGRLQIHLANPSPIDVTVYDVHGNILKHIEVKNASEGTHFWNLDEGNSKPGMKIVQVAAAGETRTFRYIPMELNGSSGHSVTHSASQVEIGLSKTAAAVDSIKVTADGYPVTTMEVESYSSTVNVTLTAGGSDRWGGPGNPPAPSAGCGSPAGTTTGKKTINSGGRNREYIIDIPSNYDQNKPYRLFFIFHWASGNADAMNRNNFYNIKNQANSAGEPSIFIAPSGIGGFWGQEDHGLFEDLLELAKTNLCVDTSRVFATGYSFGGMISYSLSTVHQDKLRAVVGMAPANWNIWIPNPKLPTPIPWLQIHGLQDETCLWVNSDSRREGGKYIVLEKAENNGCDIPGDDDFPVWQSGPHFCYEFEGCDAGYPVKICTNNGRHSGAERYTDPGQNSSWVPPTAWEFYMRF